MLLLIDFVQSGVFSLINAFTIVVPECFRHNCTDSNYFDYPNTWMIVSKHLDDDYARHTNHPNTWMIGMPSINLLSPVVLTLLFTSVCSYCKCGIP